MGELCSKYLTKGRKVAVVGSVQVSTYTGSDGATRASLEVTADEVGILSAANQGEYQERGRRRGISRMALCGWMTQMILFLFESTLL